ncbi:MAG: methyltransferase domain-containing protein [Deltaproteobacteria bacterium]|nr:methyltransferase domain-containing protein [Deltaproteobacteria bacterium]
MRRWRRAYYDQFSAVYDRFVALHSSDRQGNLRAYLAEKTGVSSGQRALDICTGTGAVLKMLVDRTGPDGLAVGVDFSRGMLAVAKTKLASRKGAFLVQADAGHLPFKSNVFDAVTCAHAFYELKGDTQDACLKDVERVLKTSKPFLMMEHELPRHRLIRLLFYIRLLSMGAKRAFQILKKEKERLESHFESVRKLPTPSGNSKIWVGIVGRDGKRPDGATSSGGNN